MAHAYYNHGYYRFHTTKLLFAHAHQALMARYQNFNRYDALLFIRFIQDAPALNRLSGYRSLFIK